MKVTPIDITHKSFNKKMFGVDEAEVQDFLQMIANQLEELIRERNTLRETLREKDITLNDFKDRDQVLKNTITTAAQMAERLRLDAEREAKLVIADAQQKAEIIIRDSRDSLKKTYQEIADLKRMRLQFEANLKALAQAHLTILDQGEKYVPTTNFPQMDFEPTTNKSNSRSTDVSPLSSQ